MTFAEARNCIESAESVMLVYIISDEHATRYQQPYQRAVFAIQATTFEPTTTHTMFIVNGSTFAALCSKTPKEKFLNFLFDGPIIKYDTNVAIRQDTTFNGFNGNQGVLNNIEYAFSAEEPPSIWTLLPTLHKHECLIAVSDSNSNEFVKVSKLHYSLSTPRVTFPVQLSTGEFRTRVFLDFSIGNPGCMQEKLFIRCTDAEADFIASEINLATYDREYKAWCISRISTDGFTTFEINREQLATDTIDPELFLTFINPPIICRTVAHYVLNRAVITGGTFAYNLFCALNTKKIEKTSEFENVPRPTLKNINYKVQEYAPQYRGMLKDIRNGIMMDYYRHILEDPRDFAREISTGNNENSYTKNFAFGFQYVAENGTFDYHKLKVLETILTERLMLDGIHMFKYKAEMLLTGKVINFPVKWHEFDWGKFAMEVHL